MEKEFPFIKKVKPNNDFDVHCTICLSNYSVTHGGKPDINIYIKRIEEQKLCAVELLSIMNNLIEKLKNKTDDLFLTSYMEKLLDNGEITRNKFTDICTLFYNLCINYLKD